MPDHEEQISSPIEADDNGSDQQGAQARKPGRGYVPEKADPNKPEQTFVVGARVRVFKPIPSGTIWVVTHAHYGGSVWQYQLVNPDNQQESYKAGNWVKQSNLRRAG